MAERGVHRGVQVSVAERKGKDRPRPSAAPDVLQLLAFVFASADLVLEIDDAGAITFATGAAVRLLGRSADSLVGGSWRDLIQPPDVDFVDAALADLKPGERRGPFRLGLAHAGSVQPATLSLFQAPQRSSATAVAISLCQPSFAQLQVDAAGFASRADFEVATTAMVKEAGKAGLPLHVDLLEFAGLTNALKALPSNEAAETERSFAAILRSAAFGGLPAASLGGDRFAVVRSVTGSDTLGERIREAAGPGVKLSIGRLAVAAGAPVESLRAIRYALDRCIASGPAAAAAGFEAALRQTMEDSSRFKALLASGRFELVYQPIVDLKSRVLHHYEALVRFSDGEGTATTIRLAEELGLVVEFDLAIVRAVAAMLDDTPREVRIAANLSAYSLQQPGFVEEILAITAGPTATILRPRLLLEVTESHKLEDLDLANRLIQRLRKAGHMVCLDDFGAGAASLDYLRRLETDVIKFDGRFVEAIRSRARDATLLGRLAELCAELDIVTVAEMIETEETAHAVAGLGVILGQGWLLGRPVSRPVAPEADGPVAARRKGARESWG